MAPNWTPIALSRDVPAGVTRAVILEGREIVIWRGHDGAAHVWEDRCPHRGMRLSLGFVRDNSLNCLYHGWQYGGSSSCIRIPAHPDLTVPPTIKANAYEATEAAGMVWIRFGGDVELPHLPAGVRPVLSLAVASDAFAAPLFSLPLGAATLHIGWHRVREGKAMLHAVMEGDAATADAIATLRTLRAEVEGELAA